MSTRAGVADPRAFLLHLFHTAVAAVQAAPAIFPHFPPRPEGRLVVLGAGKAAAAMARAAEVHYACNLEGLVIVPEGYGLPCSRIEVVEAAHPVPDARGVQAAQRILHLAHGAQAGDLVLCLISGGASALMALPASGVTLADKRAVTSALLRSGAAIVEINCVRKHLSAIKGGRLAQAAAPARVFSLIVSDVVGDDPAVIASGPTVPDPTYCRDALGVLAKYAIPIPDAVRVLLADGTLETPKSEFAHVAGHVFARPADAFAAAAAAARAAGVEVLDLGDRCAGEARAAAREQADHARAIAAGNHVMQAPCVILSGGEFVVTVSGDGRGGPNTEFALALACALDCHAGVWAIAADTDGRDGNAGAAGALIDPSTLRRAQEAGVDINDVLRRNDSAGMFAKLDDLVDPGPTYTNVNDFRAILVQPPLNSRSS